MEAFSRLHLFDVLNSLPDGVTLANADGRIVFSNVAADRILSVQAATDSTPDEWADHYGVFLPDGATPFPTDQYPLIRALAGEATQDVEMFIRNAEMGDGALISVSGQPLVDASGVPIGAAVVFRDVTELRQAQNALQVTVEELRETQRRKDELASFVVHDLKNPLSVILASCDLLSMTEADEGAMEDLRAIRTATQRIQRMVMDLLDIQMADDGALKLVSARVDLSRLLDEVREITQPLVHGSGGRLVCTVGEDTYISGDHALLVRVFLNLIDNCVKYGPPEGTIWIDVESDNRESGTLVVTVRDEGPGVPDHLRGRIFDRYATEEREDQPRTSTSRGLGLHFCRVVAEAHGGAVWVESGDPGGAKFCVRLSKAE